MNTTEAKIQGWDWVAAECRRILAEIAEARQEAEES